MSLDITKQGIQVKVGQVWADLDNRMFGRKVTITRVSDGFAYYGKNGKRPCIKVSRMHKHSTGFELVSETPSD